MDVLQVLKDAQDEHGLRHGDHQRYRRYCTKRLTRLRRALKLPQGDKRRYKGQPVTPEHLAQDLSHLTVLLMNAERAWSYAQQLKQESRDKPRCKHHMVRRLGKAVKFAKIAENICDAEECAEKVDARTKLEVKSYAAWLRGMLYFELERWQDCLQELTKAKAIYETIASALDAESRVVYDQRIEEMNPNIRYCAYNLGDESATSFDELLKLRYQDAAGSAAGSTDESMLARLDTLITQHREKQAATLNEVSWLDRVVPVKNERVRVFLLGLKDLEASIARVTDTESKTNLFEELLNQCREAVQNVADELKNTVSALGASSLTATFAVFTGFFRRLRESFLFTQPSQPGVVSNLQYLHSYLQYVRLSKTIDRAQIIIGSLDRGEQAKSTTVLATGAGGLNPGSGATHTQKQQPVGAAAATASRRKVKPQDYIRLYDTVVQSQMDILQLPGFGGGQGRLSSAEYNRIDAELLVNRALRCRYIGLALQAVKKYSEAHAIFKRSLDYIRQATAKYSQQGSGDDRASMLQRLGALTDEIEGHSNTASLYSVLNAEKQVAGQLNTQLKALQLNMQTDDDETTDGGNSAAAEGGGKKIKPPQKPMFFDIALDQVLAWEPPTEQEQQKLAAKAAAAAKTSSVSSGAQQKQTKTQPQQQESSGAAGGLGKLFKSFWSSDARQ